MRLALLKGTTYNPWHLLPYNRMQGKHDVVVFRQVGGQHLFRLIGEPPLDIREEPLELTSETGILPQRLWKRFRARAAAHAPGIAPFYERLQGFDLIQSWELYTDWTVQGLEAKRRWGIPLCVMVWDNIPFNMEANHERRALKEEVAHTADRFIVHTERSRRVLDVEGVDKSRVISIDPGVDVKRFSPGPPERQRYGLHPKDFVILFVGWFLPRKGLEFLLLALRELVHDPSLRKHRLRLLVVGGGPGKDRIEKLTERLELQENCVFTGPLPYREMPLVYRSADVFVLPSIAAPEWQEQQGMALLEAMACGTPVISTQTGAIPELVENAACLCQPNDFVSLYEALKDLMLDKGARQYLGKRGRAQVMRRFQISRHVRQLLDVYRDLLA